MKSIKEWYSSFELAGITGLPITSQGINKIARANNWKKRAKMGIQGGKAVEYHYTSLPIETQVALGLINLIPNPELWTDLDTDIDIKELKPSGQNKLETLQQAACNHLIEQGKGYGLDLDNLNSDEKVLIESYRKLSGDTRKAVCQFIENLASNS